MIDTYETYLNYYNVKRDLLETNIVEVKTPAGTLKIKIGRQNTSEGCEGTEGAQNIK